MLGLEYNPPMLPSPLRVALEEVASMVGSDEYSLRIAATMAQDVISNPPVKPEYIREALDTIRNTIKPYIKHDANINRVYRVICEWYLRYLPGPRMEDNPILLERVVPGNYEPELGRYTQGRVEGYLLTKADVRRIAAELGFYHKEIDCIIKELKTAWVHVKTKIEADITVAKIGRGCIKPIKATRPPEVGDFVRYFPFGKDYLSRMDFFPIIRILYDGRGIVTEAKVRNSNENRIHDVKGLVPIGVAPAKFYSRKNTKIVWWDKFD